jgi:hypothetical protein
MSVRGRSRGEPCLSGGATVDRFNPTDRDRGNLDQLGAKRLRRSLSARFCPFLVQHVPPGQSPVGCSLVDARPDHVGVQPMADTARAVRQVLAGEPFFLPAALTCDLTENEDRPVDHVPFVSCNRRPMIIAATVRASTACSSCSVVDAAITERIAGAAHSITSSSDKSPGSPLLIAHRKPSSLMRPGASTPWNAD